MWKIVIIAVIIVLVVAYAKWRITALSLSYILAKEDIAVNEEEMKSAVRFVMQKLFKIR